MKDLSTVVTTPSHEQVVHCITQCTLYTVLYRYKYNTVKLLLTLKLNLDKSTGMIGENAKTEIICQFIVDKVIT